MASFIRTHDLLAAGERVLVGVSGGVDSMVLAQVLHRLGYAVAVAHVNYQLRGAEAEADEAFVRDWCAARQPAIPFHRLRHDMEGAAQGDSLQAAARAVRYAFFARMACAAHIEQVAVAHHRDDQAETLLLHLLRGSGIEGLAGMAPARPLHQDAPGVRLIRPLLGERRAAIEAYAQAEGVPWREDASNERLTYDRNVMRAAILPVLEQHFPGATDHIAHTADLVRGYRTHTVQPELAERFSRCVAEASDEGGGLQLDRYCAQPSVWRHRLVLEALQRWLPEAPYTAALAREIDALRTAQVGRHVEVAGGAVWRERGTLRFVPGPRPARMDPRPVPWNEDVPVPGGTLRVEPLDGRPATLDAGTPHVVYADAEALQGPLAVRSWQDGDRFQPLGMTGTKLVSDLLTDAQVPSHRRARVLVLCTAQGIAWVVGHRLAHPVRVHDGTERLARLSFTPDESAAQNAPPVSSDVPAL